MKNTKTTKRKSSAAKKLVPATGMLLVSALMLTTSTYAWFTMSREVEVTGIQMAATVPEDLQISLGKITNGELNKQTGLLTFSSGALVAPEAETDWSNSALVSSYYAFGKIMPASSTDGKNVYFTPDADGVGKTVAGEANYYQASAGLTAYEYKAAVTTPGSEAPETFAASGGGDSANTTLHAFASTTEKAADATTGTWAVSTNNGTDGGYVKGTTWKNTNDDGYYVDVPVWIRSSSDSAVTLKVEGYVLPYLNAKPVSAADLELYKAARIAILEGEDVTASADTGATAATAGNPVQANNIIPLNDGVNTVAYDGTTHAVTSVTPKANKYDGSSILDSDNITAASQRTSWKSGYTYAAFDLVAVGALASATSTADTTGTYVAGTYEKYTPYSATAGSGANVVATIEKAGSGAEYGNAKKLVLRVWLDGEDAQCWNKNAGQDFAITLKFSKIEA